MDHIPCIGVIHKVDLVGTLSGGQLLSAAILPDLFCRSRLRRTFNKGACLAACLEASRQRHIAVFLSCFARLSRLLVHVSVLE